MNRRPALAAAIALATALSGCAARPDTTLHPQPAAVTYADLRHPLRDARLMVDGDSAAARWQAQHPGAWLDPITRTPQAHWLNGPEDLTGVPALVARARRQHATPVLVAYDVPNRGCSKFTQGAGTSAAYDKWIGDLIAALGDEPAVIVLEPDAVAADCFDDARAGELTRAVAHLEAAGHSVYIDAGHSHWLSTGDAAARLLRAGIAGAEGFAVNVSNRRSTDEAYQWARELSDLVGGRDFVIDTSRNGLGPPASADDWCNPQHQALGAQPTTDTGRPGLAALLWVKPPGESDGLCGGEQTYLFSPRQARNLILNSTQLPAAAHDAAAAFTP